MISRGWATTPFKEGLLARVFQVFHALLFVLLAMRGLVIGLVIAMIVGAGIFYSGLFLDEVLNKTFPILSVISYFDN